MWSRPRIASECKDCFKMVLTGALPTVKGFDYRHLNQQGEDRFISLTIYPEKDQLGRIIGVEGVGEDITEKKRLESELEKAKNLAHLGEFSSAVAHQIRNPLGNILMGSKLLQKELGIEGQSPENNDLESRPDSRPDDGQRWPSRYFSRLCGGNPKSESGRNRVIGIHKDLKTQPLVPKNRDHPAGHLK